MIMAEARTWEKLMIRLIAAAGFALTVATSASNVARAASSAGRHDHCPIAWPALTIITFISFYGAFVLVDGVIAIWAAIGGGASAWRWWLAL